MPVGRTVPSDTPALQVCPFQAQYSSMRDPRSPRIGAQRPQLPRWKMRWIDYELQRDRREPLDTHTCIAASAGHAGYRGNHQRQERSWQFWSEADEDRLRWQDLVRLCCYLEGSRWREELARQHGQLSSRWSGYLQCRWAVHRPSKCLWHWAGVGSSDRDSRHPYRVPAGLCAVALRRQRKEEGLLVIHIAATA
jgi:hypothetical protein